MRTIGDALIKVNKYLQEELEKNCVTSVQFASSKLSEYLGPIGKSVPFMIPPSGDIEIASITMKIRKKRIKPVQNVNSGSRMTVSSIELTKGKKETPLVFLATQIKSASLAKELKERTEVDDEITTFFASMPEEIREECLLAIGRWNKLPYEAKMKIESWSEDGSMNIGSLFDLKKKTVKDNQSRPFGNLSNDELKSRYLMERRCCANSIDNGFVPDSQTLNLIEHEMKLR